MKRRRRKASTSTLYDVDVCAPEALDIGNNDTNERRVAAWWEKVKLYAEAMRMLDRVVILAYDHDDQVYHVASVPEQPDV